MCNSRTQASVQTNNKYAMADSFTSRRGEMKDSASLSETGSDKGDDSQGIKDDVYENDSEYIEERFRVDRKKLEQMLQGLYCFSCPSVCYSATYMIINERISYIVTCNFSNIVYT